MKIKNITILSVFAIFLLSVLSHFVYDWFPNTFTSIFFPVNESIFEHTKMTFTTMMIWGGISYLLFENIRKKNFITALLTSTLTTIITLVIIFTPIFYLMGKQDNIFLTLSIYFISIIVGQIVNYFILKRNTNNKILNIISLLLIPIIFTIYGILTYYPIKVGLLYDYQNHKYGLYTKYE